MDGTRDILAVEPMYEESEASSTSTCSILSKPGVSKRFGLSPQ
jgi:hypothetical protein